MGDKNFGAQSEAIDGAVHAASGALMKSGNPYLMAAGAALEGANFLTKAGGQTVQGFDVDIASSGYGNLGHMESSSSRDFGAMIGLGGLNAGKMQAKLARRNEKLKQALLHTKYLYNHEDDKTVDVFKATIMKGVKNSFLYKISKHIPQVYKNFNNLTDIEKNYLLKYFLYLTTKKEKKILALLGEDYNLENELERLKKTFYKIKGQPKLYELCVNTLKNNKTYKINKTIVNNIINELQIYYPENNNNTSIKIDINSILYQDSDVQMTSLIPSGNIGANSKVSGAKLRPLIVTVYFVNNQQYELTTEGKTMMEIISNNIKQNLQEDKKNVELSHQNILIFDDDMDTRASLKLCVDTMNKVLNDYRVSNNTQIKCLTLFT
jgi:hypothetical protein